MTRCLLLDIGNSRIKAAWAGAVPLQSLPTVAHQAQAAAAIAELASVIETPDAVWVSHVLGAAAEAAIAAALATHWSLTPRFARARAEAPGLLRSAYAEPERLGVDRWLVMLAARAQVRGAAVIADAGTALTVDWVDAQGQHQGGFIAPGLLTAQAGVLGATRFATRDVQASYHGGLGRDTEACVRQGAMLGCLGAIDRAAALAGDSARRLMTGGDAEHLLPHLAAGWEHRPLLVLEGLNVLALADA